MRKKLIAATLGIFFLVPMNEDARTFSFPRLFSRAPKPVGRWLRDARYAGVNPASGSLHLIVRSSIFPPGSLPAQITPAYNSVNPQDSPFGFGWTSNATASIAPSANGTLTYTDANGTQVTFVQLGPLNQPVNGTGSLFSQPVNYFATLTPFPCPVTASPITMSLRDKTGTVTAFEMFAPDGSVPLQSQSQCAGSFTASFIPAGSTFLVMTETDRNGNTVTYNRDFANKERISSITDVHGRTISFTYNGQGKIVTATDSTGRSTQYAYDGSNNMISQTDPNGDMTQYAYDSFHRMTQITYPNGGHHNLNYVSATDGRIASESDDSGNNQQSYAYFGSSVPSPTGTAVGSTTVTDALGRLTFYQWQEVSGLRKFTKIVDPLANATAFTYDTNMNLVSQTDPLGRTTKYSYDTLGNVISATDANGGTTQATYEQIFSQPTSVSDPNANKTNLFYDAKGNLVQVQDAGNNFTSLAYDSQGHVTGTKDPLGDITAFSYNGNGALTSVVDPLNRTTNITRDALSRVTQNTDPASKQTGFQYDAQSNLTQVNDALTGVTKYGYATGHTGRLLNEVTDAKNHTTSFGYDNIARLTTVTNALSQAKIFSYDLNSNLSQVVDAKGQTIKFSYDNLDRLVTKTLPEGLVQYQYDFIGNLTQVTNYNGSGVAMSYDNLNRVVQVKQTLPNGFTATIGYTYDSNGNRTGMSTPWGSFSYSYDSLNRLISITNPQGKSFTFAYDSLGRRIKLDYPNGIETTYAYDNASQLTQILHRLVSNNAPVAFDNYTYDADGNRLSMQDMDGVHSYVYDNLNRLILATHPSASLIPILNETFSYDSVGNRLADSNIINYSYDAANRLLSNSSFTYTYDADGNQTGKKDASNNQTTYVYDSQNELAQAQLTGGVTQNNKYDALGRRVEKSTGAVSGQTIRYIYDGLDILAMLDGNNNLIAVFTHDFGIDRPLQMHRSDGNDFFIHADGLGSIVVHTDGSANPVEKVKYQAYGQPVFVDFRSGAPAIENQSFTGNPFTFTARENDPESGLVYYRARIYDPIAGRFLQPDPINNLNLYVYANDNSVNFIDPSGAFINVIIGAVAGGAGAYISGGGHFTWNVGVGILVGGLIGAVPPLAPTFIGLTATGFFGGVAGGLAGQIGQPTFQPGQVGIGALTGTISGLGGGSTLLLGGSVGAAMTTSSLLGGGMSLYYAGANGLPFGGSSYALFPKSPDVCAVNRK